MRKTFLSALLLIGVCGTLQADPRHSFAWQFEGFSTVGGIHEPAPSPEEVARGLTHENLSIRRIAAAKLGELDADGVRKILSAVVSALKDPHDAVSVPAAFALVQAGAKSTDLVPVLRRGLEDPYVGYRYTSAILLNTAEPSALQEILQLQIAYLKDARPEARRTAVEVLGEIGGSTKEVQAALIATINDPDDGIRRAAVSALRKDLTRPKDVVSALVGATKDRNDYVRGEAAAALASHAATAHEVAPIVLAWLNDPNQTSNGLDTVSLVAMLGQKEPDVIPALREMLKSPHEIVRLRVVETLGRMQTTAKATTPSLVPLLKDSSPAMRETAARALGQIETKPADGTVPALVAALHDQEPRVRASVLKSLNYVGGISAEVIPSLKNLLLDSNDDVRRAAVWALPEASLVETLQDKDVRVRRAALLAISASWRITDSRDLALEVNKLVKDDDAEVRRVAVAMFIAIDRSRPMGHLSTEDQTRHDNSGKAEAAAVLHLATALSDSDPLVRAATARKLGSFDPIPKAAIAALIEALKDSGPDVRAAARQALAEVGPAAKQALPLLLISLKDEDASVRCSAAYALGRIGDSDDVVSALLQALYDPESNVRDAAASALCDVREPAATKAASGLLTFARDICPSLFESASHLWIDLGKRHKFVVPGLVEALKKPDRKIRESIAWILGEIGLDAAGASSALVGLLQDFESNHHTVPEAAAAALEKIGPRAKDVVPALVATLVQQQWEGSGFQVLQDIGPAAAPELAKCLQHPDGRYRRAAAWALGKLGHDSVGAVPQLVAALDEQSKEVRAMIADALGQIGPDAKAAIPALERELKGLSGSVRGAAAKALGEIAREDSLPTLIDLALHDRDDGVRGVASEALGMLGSVAIPAVPKLSTALRDSDDDVRESAAMALAAIGPDAADAEPTLVAALRDKNEDVRVQVATALGAIGPRVGQAVPPLIELLDDKTPRVRAAAIGALSAIGPKSIAALPKLVEAIKDDDSQVISSAVGAFERLGPAAKQAIPALIELLRGPEGVRASAAQALGGIGPDAKEAVPALSEALKSKDSEFRSAAASALRRIDPMSAKAAGLP